MKKYRKVMQECKAFKLVEFKRDHKKWFEVQLDRWGIRDESFRKEICEYFDPNKNKTFGGDTRWRFWNREDAEQNYLYAVMRWS